MANPIVTAAIAAAKAAAKKRSVAELKTGSVRGSVKSVKKSINNPKMQRKYENLTKGSNTLSPNSMTIRVNKAKPVPVKKKAK